MRIGELSNLAGRATNTAADVEDLHAGLDTDLHGEEVLMTSNGLVEGLAWRIPAEVEALAPTILVQIGRKVVIAAQRTRSQYDSQLMVQGGCW